MKDKKLKDIQDQLDAGVDLATLLDDNLKEYIITAGLSSAMEQILKVQKQVKELQKQVKELQEQINTRTKEYKN